MANGICDVCKTRPASFRAQVSVNGERRVMELCEEDYRKLARRAGRPASPLEALFSGRSLFDEFFGDSPLGSLFGDSPLRGPLGGVLPEAAGGAEPEADLPRRAARRGAGGAVDRRPAQRTGEQAAAGGRQQGRRVRSAGGRYRASAVGAGRIGGGAHPARPVQDRRRRSAPPDREGGAQGRGPGRGRRDRGQPPPEGRAEPCLHRVERTRPFLCRSRTSADRPGRGGRGPGRRHPAPPRA
ncbi:MAG: hypothetical protein KatS3mg118_2670 [Paracoccaceae bacterium]|nr:MAG: hypothetical protein KatS3mg118_2670 [Paracoccaceae bacterium]